MPSVFGSRRYTYLSENPLLAPKRRHSLFYDETGEYVLKFFPAKDDETVEKINHLIRFRENFPGKNPKLNYLVSAFPIEMVYSSERKQPNEWCGFVMNRCRDKSLDVVGVRVGGFEEYFNVDSYVKLLTICARLCLCCQVFHQHRFLLSDIKPDNFFVTKEGFVYPIDTDGFSYNGGPSQPPLPNYCPGKMDYNNIHSYHQNMETESYALTILLLQMLTIELSGKAPLDKIRSYDLLGVDEYAEALKGSKKLKGVRELFYKRWFLMPKDFRDIFINALCNRYYLLPTASGWYSLLKEHIDALEEQGVDMKIVPNQLPAPVPEPGFDIVRYFKQPKDIQNILITSDDIHEQTHSLEERLSKTSSELTKIESELANVKEESAKKSKEQQKEIEELKAQYKKRKKLSTYLFFIVMLLLGAVIGLLYQGGQLNSFLTLLQQLYTSFSFS